MRTARSDRLRIVRVGVAFCTTLVLTGGCFEAEQVNVKREREILDALCNNRKMYEQLDKSE